MLSRDGTGWKGKPYRYWLPSQEAKWPETYKGLEDWMTQIDAANAHVIPQPSQPLPPPPDG